MSTVDVETDITSVRLNLQPGEAEKLAAILGHMDHSAHSDLSRISRLLQDAYPDVRSRWALMGDRYIEPRLVRYPPEDED